MCGILGMVVNGSRARLPDAERTGRALARLQHRGPDGRGEYRDQSVWLGHTRLSILDLSAAGSQPMRSADQRHVITYNGEVYNFKELRQRHALNDLRSGSDTEVVLRLFSESGVVALGELNGMFAFCVYDRQARKIWLARDRTGIKPLYFSLSNDALLFASEIKGILALSDGQATCRLDSLHEWLYFGNALGGNTLYEGIQQLLPGHFLQLDLESFRVAIRPYWSLEDVTQNVSATSAPRPEVAVQQTRQLLEQAVHRQLVSDVPVAAFLSGGVDSSAITAFAARAYGGRLATYSAGFDFGDCAPELRKARSVARLYDTDHHEFHVAGAGAAVLVEKMVDAHDSPFADPANIPLYLMATEISAHTKVVLQGDGGDELFGGYRRYSVLAHYRYLHALAGTAESIARLLPLPALRERAGRYLRALDATDIADTVALLLTPEDRCERPEAVFGSTLRTVLMGSDPFARHRACVRRAKTRDVANAMSFTDLEITLPDLYLEKVDRSTMAASLEVRVPFLDNELVEFVAPLPPARKFPGGRKKWLLKLALRGVVPDEVLFGPKVGLEVPFGQWLRSSLRPFFLDQLASFVREFPDVLDAARVAAVYERHCAGNNGRSYLLWKLLNLMVWARAKKVRFA
jgi:asparagine synthase (glutamine-hydrolysing)